MTDKKLKAASNAARVLWNRSDTEVKIRRILEAWGPRTTYRYLRDHGQLEAFCECLPFPNYTDNEPDVILATFQGSWDDFTDEALQKLETWQLASSEAALVPKIAKYADELIRSGHKQEAQQVLRVARTLTDRERLEHRYIRAEALNLDCLVRRVGPVVGFGADHLPGRVTAITTSTNMSSKKTTVKISVYVSQRDESYTVDCEPGTLVEASVLVRPSYAVGLRLGALDRLLKIESMLEGSPELQSRAARIRHEVQDEICKEVDAAQGHPAPVKKAAEQKMTVKVFVGPVGTAELAGKFALAGLQVDTIGTEHLYISTTADSPTQAVIKVIDAAKSFGLHLTTREVNVTSPLLSQ